MKFDFDQNYKKVSEIYAMQKSLQLVVDNSYQRKSVWNEKDQVRLIETIILNLVVPSVYFWNSETDPNNGNTITHIVDGQQRLTAIRKFVTNELVLTKSYLMDDEIKEKFGNKSFSQLDDDTKKNFWDYKLSVIEIAREVKLADIKEMFKRLNLTDYNLNSQEKRNAIEGDFDALAKELSENRLWSDNELFKPNIIKRMKDIEFCADLIILYKRGIVDQTTDKVLNEAYSDYSSGYEDAEDDKKAIEAAMEIAQRFICDETLSFLRRTSQLYSIFSLVFYIQREKIELSDSEIDKFSKFVYLYGNYKNEDNTTLDLDADERTLYDQIKKYKQASSEGVRKQINRMTRYDVLKKIVVNKQFDNELMDKLNEKLK